MAGSKLKVAQTTPSEELVEEASTVVDVTDVNGRKLTLKRPNVLAQYRLIEVVGPETAQNSVYMSMAMPVFWVQAINGEKIAQPRSKPALEALISRLDDEGLQAVIDHMVEIGAPVDEEQAEVDLKND